MVLVKTMNLLSNNPIILLVQFLALILSIGFHEFSHVLAAYLQGDQTGKLLGRLTLNPIRHLDPYGTMFMILSLLSGIGIGWGKPAPFNPYNLRFRRWGPVIVAFAGPISNILFATLAGYILVAAGPSLGPNNLLTIFLTYLTIWNAGLAVFNLIPVAPLDGSHLVEAVLGPTNAFVQYMHRFGWMILLFLIFFSRGLIGTFISAGIHLILTAVGLGRLY